ncbi:PC-Esterase domain-containing protein/PMR5N domain-containing protein [Cephalotus follicularis]|uniref:PC-Esterase domain-containing protein/PMR5N domain-containing protein n=1 Tax=Cephalotus follicularis TaxID=3775 RepID=A0A1Q3CPM0_CEPFO|nr:PC-Esterase domain-containing protein/PMR5N domain-containing protein [Cephalotus follicularis]
MAHARPKTLLLIFFVAIFLSFCNAKSSQFGIEDESWLDEEENEVDMVQTRRNSPTHCDLTTGRWIYDESYPLYDTDCPYLSTAVTCQRNGRPDSQYQKWRWAPHGCSIPRFDALKFLGKMRRKRMMLIGDSIMRNQWESLVCLVQGVIPTGSKRVTYNGPSMAFHALDFEISIEFSWAPLLVELKKASDNKRILHLDLIEENARYWRGADILVFDSAHWWTHSDKYSSWDYYMEGHSLFKNMNPMVAYQRGLTTWAKWIDLNVDPRQTRVIFRSMSPRHNREKGWKCYNQSRPLANLSHQHVPQQLLVLKGVLRQMRFPVYLQDITTMSALRRDGHPSVYRRAMGQEERQHPIDLSSDCNHWCLPGVPDTWNEMLTALL